jgi:hypothetical protein
LKIDTLDLIARQAGRFQHRMAVFEQLRPLKLDVWVVLGDLVPALGVDGGYQISNINIGVGLKELVKVDSLQKIVELLARSAEVVNKVQVRDVACLPQEVRPNKPLAVQLKAPLHEPQDVGA